MLIIIVKCGGRLKDNRYVVSILALAFRFSSAVVLLLVEALVGKIDTFKSESCGLNGISMRRGAQHKV